MRVETHWGENLYTGPGPHGTWNHARVFLLSDPTTTRMYAVQFTSSLRRRRKIYTSKVQYNYMSLWWVEKPTQEINNYGEKKKGESHLA